MSGAPLEGARAPKREAQPDRGGSSSSDEDGGNGGARRREAPSDDAGGKRGAPGALLERCSDASAARSSGPAQGGAPPAASEREDEKEEGEGVFEIRDFTTASSFERIAHQMSLAAKKWAAVLKASPDETGGLVLREEFDHYEYKYELFFQLAAQQEGGMPAPSCGANLMRSPTAERVGLHTFPARAHRLQRWFGVQHFVIVSVRGQTIDMDSAHTVLSAALLGVHNMSSHLPQPLACFVPVEGGRRRRYIGELAHGGWRLLYTTDWKSAPASLEHLEGLQEFFWQKLAADPDDPSHALMIGTRFTYFVDAFDLVNWAGGSAASTQDASVAEVGSPSRKGSADSNGTGAGLKEPPDSKTLEGDPTDPVDVIHLHCIWPSFPRGAFIDNAVFSELDPRHAPYWKIRMTRRDEVVNTLTVSLRNLLEFRKEALTVRSAEHSVQPQMPKTALESLSYAIQESLESILLPTEGEMVDLTSQCLSAPTSLPHGGDPKHQLVRAGLRGVQRGTRLLKFAELGAKMRCFKGMVMLWCQVLLQMRRHWDEKEVLPPGAPSPQTHRIGARGVRSEFFDAADCLVQQKLMMVQRSTEAARDGRATTAGSTAATTLQVASTGEPLLAPPLLQPALMTEDTLVQRDMAAASISDPAERAGLHSREVRSDMAALKAANPHAALADFLEWRSVEERLSVEPFPMPWLEQLWETTTAQPASEQMTSLFEPEREAEMALHYLENIDGTQLLLQVFRVLLNAALEELSEGIDEHSPAQLRVLRDRAVAAVLLAFDAASQGSDDADDQDRTADANATATVGETAEFPDEEKLQTAMSAVEALEAAVRLAASLRAKLPGAGQALLEPLLNEGEAVVTSNAQRRVVENLFDRGRTLAQAAQGREVHDEKGTFESLPLAKEFVLLLQPVTAGSSDGDAATSDGAGAPFAGGVKRIFAEIREHHLRLAIVRGLSIA